MSDEREGRPGPADDDADGTAGIPTWEPGAPVGAGGGRPPVHLRAL